MKVLDPPEQLIHFRKLSWNHQKVDVHLESQSYFADGLKEAKVLYL